MSERAAKNGFRTWHKRDPGLAGSLSISWPDTIYYEGKVSYILYASTKWENKYDPYIKRLIGGSLLITDLHSDASPQPYAHEFSSIANPSLWTDESSYAGQSTKSPPRLPGDLYCLGTVHAIRLHNKTTDPNDEKSSCRFVKSVLPILLGSTEMGHKLILYNPGRKEIGLILGGIFRITSRGLVG